MLVIPYYRNNTSILLYLLYDYNIQYKIKIIYIIIYYYFFDMDKGRLKDIPVKELESGHIAIYGPTESGKTRYAKTLITQVLKPHNLIVFLGSIDKSWDVYKTPTKLPATDYEMKGKVFDDFDANIEKVLEECLIEHSEGRKTVIVFDDFNNKINTQTNTRYIELFTQGRHAGIRVINMSQSGAGIGKQSRGNIRYAALLYINNIDFVRGLSSFLNNNYARLSELMESIAGSRNVILIDCKYQDIVIDNSENYRVNIPGTLAVAGEAPDIYNRLMGEFDAGIMQPQRTENVGNDTVGNVGSVGTKNVMNNGVYNDNTQINFQNNIEIKKRLELNRAEQNITVDNYKFQRTMKSMTEKDELYDLLMKYTRTHEEFVRCVTLLTTICKLDKNTILDNFAHYSQKFLDRYYPGAKYKAKNKVIETLTNNRDLITNPNVGNVGDLVLRGVVHVAKNNSRNTNLLGSIVRNTPVAFLLDD